MTDAIFLNIKLLIDNENTLNELLSHENNNQYFQQPYNSLSNVNDDSLKAKSFLTTNDIIEKISQACGINDLEALCSKRAILTSKIARKIITYFCFGEKVLFFCDSNNELRLTTILDNVENTETSNNQLGSSRKVEDHYKDILTILLKLIRLSLFLLSESDTDALVIPCLNIFLNSLLQCSLASFIDGKTIRSIFKNYYKKTLNYHDQNCVKFLLRRICYFIFANLKSKQNDKDYSLAASRCLTYLLLSSKANSLDDDCELSRCLFFKYDNNETVVTEKENHITTNQFQAPPLNDPKINNYAQANIKLSTKTYNDACMTEDSILHNDSLITKHNEDTTTSFDVSNKHFSKHLSLITESVPNNNSCDNKHELSPNSCSNNYDTNEHYLTNSIKANGTERRTEVSINNNIPANCLLRSSTSDGEKFTTNPETENSGVNSLKVSAFSLGQVFENTEAMVSKDKLDDPNIITDNNNKETLQKQADITTTRSLSDRNLTNTSLVFGKDHNNYDILDDLISSFPDIFTNNILILDTMIKQCWAGFLDRRFDIDLSFFLSGCLTFIKFFALNLPKCTFQLEVLWYNCVVSFLNLGHFQISQAQRNNIASILIKCFIDSIPSKKTGLPKLAVLLFLYDYNCEHSNLAGSILSELTNLSNETFTESLLNSYDVIQSAVLAAASEHITSSYSLITICQKRCFSLLNDLLTEFNSNFMLSCTSTHNNYIALGIMNLSTKLNVEKVLNMIQTCYKNESFDELFTSNEFTALLEHKRSRNSTITHEQVLALVLRSFHDQNLAVVGEILGSKSKNFSSIQLAYMKSFNFTNLSILSAMRLLFGSFKLPVETQQIDRVLELFGREYFIQQPIAKEHNVVSQKTGPDDLILNELERTPRIIAAEEKDGTHDFIVIDSADLIYLLTFAILMINTDLHHPDTKTKMSVQKFISNVYRIDDLKVLTQKYLRSIYFSIKKHALTLQINDNAKSAAIAQNDTAVNYYLSTLVMPIDIYFDKCSLDTLIKISTTTVNDFCIKDQFLKFLFTFFAKLKMPEMLLQVLALIKHSFNIGSQLQHSDLMITIFNFLIAYVQPIFTFKSHLVLPFIFDCIKNTHWVVTNVKQAYALIELLFILDRRLYAVSNANPNKDQIDSFSTYTNLLSSTVSKESGWLSAVSGIFFQSPQAVPTERTLPQFQLNSSSLNDKIINDTYNKSILSGDVEMTNDNIYILHIFGAYSIKQYYDNNPFSDSDWQREHRKLNSLLERIESDSSLSCVKDHEISEKIYALTHATIKQYLGSINSISLHVMNKIELTDTAISLPSIFVMVCSNSQTDSVGTRESYTCELANKLIDYKFLYSSIIYDVCPILSYNEATFRIYKNVFAEALPIKLLFSISNCHLIFDSSFNQEPIIDSLIQKLRPLSDNFYIAALSEHCRDNKYFSLLASAINRTNKQANNKNYKVYVSFWLKFLFEMLLDQTLNLLNVITHTNEECSFDANALVKLNAIDKEDHAHECHYCYLNSLQAETLNALYLLLDLKDSVLFSLIDQSIEKLQAFTESLSEIEVNTANLNSLLNTLRFCNLLNQRIMLINSSAKQSKNDNPQVTPALYCRHLQLQLFSGTVYKSLFLNLFKQLPKYELLFRTFLRELSQTVFLDVLPTVMIVKGWNVKSNPSLFDASFTSSTIPYVACLEIINNYVQLFKDIFKSIDQTCDAAIDFFASCCQTLSLLVMYSETAVRNQAMTLLRSVINIPLVLDSKLILYLFELIEFAFIPQLSYNLRTAFSVPIFPLPYRTTNILKKDQNLTGCIGYSLLSIINNYVCDYQAFTTVFSSLILESVIEPCDKYINQLPMAIIAQRILQVASEFKKNILLLKPYLFKSSADISVDRFFVDPKDFHKIVNVLMDYATSIDETAQVDEAFSNILPNDNREVSDDAITHEISPVNSSLVTKSDDLNVPDSMNYHMQTILMSQITDPSPDFTVNGQVDKLMSDEENQPFLHSPATGIKNSKLTGNLNGMSNDESRLINNVYSEDIQTKQSPSAGDDQQIAENSCNVGQPAESVVLNTDQYKAVTDRITSDVMCSTPSIKQINRSDRLKQEKQLVNARNSRKLKNSCCIGFFVIPRVVCVLNHEIFQARKQKANVEGLTEILKSFLVVLISSADEGGITELEVGLMATSLSKELFDGLLTNLMSKENECRGLTKVQMLMYNFTRTLLISENQKDIAIQLKDILCS